VGRTLAECLAGSPVLRLDRSAQDRYAAYYQYANKEPFEPVHRRH
jgi:hypothetical protein